MLWYGKHAGHEGLRRLGKGGQRMHGSQRVRGLRRWIEAIAVDVVDGRRMVRKLSVSGMSMLRYRKRGRRSRCGRRLKRWRRVLLGFAGGLCRKGGVLEGPPLEVFLVTAAGNAASRALLARRLRLVALEAFCFARYAACGVGIPASASSSNNISRQPSGSSAAQTHSPP